jgi:hypothetical protein
MMIRAILIGKGIRMGQVAVTEVPKKKKNKMLKKKA